jgi:hypothetical protein
MAEEGSNRSYPIVDRESDCRNYLAYFLTKQIGCLKRRPGLYAHQPDTDRRAPRV